MTYKLNPLVRKISSPVVVVTKAERIRFENGNAAAESSFQKQYRICSVEAENNEILLRLQPCGGPDPDWSDSELSFF